MTPRTHYTEVACISRPLVFRHSRSDPIIETICNFKKYRRIPSRSDTVANVKFVTFRGLIKFDQNADWILEIAINHRNIVGFGESEAGRDCCLMTKVSTQP